MYRYVFAFALALCVSAAEAGEFNKVLNVGDAAPAWKDLPGTDEAQHSSTELDEKKFMVVVFTCNSCPVAVSYEERIIAFAEENAEHVDVVAINVNRVAEDRLDKMRERAEEKKYPYAYLFDESQQIAKDFGAAGTPEFFLISPARKIVYMGAMDDNDDPAKVTKHYLEDALAAALEGKEPPVKETYAEGCRIRFARERRK